MTKRIKVFYSPQVTMTTVRVFKKSCLQMVSKQQQKPYLVGCTPPPAPTHPLGFLISYTYQALN